MGVGRVPRRARVHRISDLFGSGSFRESRELHHRPDALYAGWHRPQQRLGTAHERRQFHDTGSAAAVARRPDGGAGDRRGELQQRDGRAGDRRQLRRRADPDRQHRVAAGMDRAEGGGRADPGVGRSGPRADQEEPGGALHRGQRRARAHSSPCHRRALAAHRARGACEPCRYGRHDRARLDERSERGPRVACPKPGALRGDKQHQHLSVPGEALLRF